MNGLPHREQYEREEEGMKSDGYLLDTSICVFLFRGNRVIEQRLNQIGADRCYITDVVVAELMFGAFYSDRTGENLRQVEDFVSEIKVIPFSETIIAFAQERAKLWRAGKKIEDFDLLIGSAAKAKGLTMVTRNVRHFEHIEGLAVEDWVNEEG